MTFVPLESRPAGLTAGTAAHDVASLDPATVTPTDIDGALARAGTPGVRLGDLAALLSPAAGERLEELATAARALTRKRFGPTVRLFAPLYLSNECVSVCTYCGFSATNEIARRTLTVDELLAEADALVAQGFRSVLLVAGEHARIISKDYLLSCVRALSPRIPALSVEVQVWDTAFYRDLVDAGCDGLVVYQESYNRDTYAATHLKGKKRNYEWRLAAPDRGAAAGMRRLGIGALLGLHPDWRTEAIALAAHSAALMKRWWRTEVSIALPRLRPAAGGYEPTDPVSDRDLAQLVCALRLVLPDVGISMSTRESATLRDHLLPLGVTTMSAGSHTAPGGYAAPSDAEAQFEISDERSPADVAAALRTYGYDPVWKDWQRA